MPWEEVSHLLQVTKWSSLLVAWFDEARSRMCLVWQMHCFVVIACSQERSALRPGQAPRNPSNWICTGVVGLWAHLHVPLPSRRGDEGLPVLRLSHSLWACSWHHAHAHEQPGPKSGTGQPFLPRGVAVIECDVIIDCQGVWLYLNLFHTTLMKRWTKHFCSKNSQLRHVTQKLVLPVLITRFEYAMFYCTHYYTPYKFSTYEFLLRF